MELIFDRTQADIDEVQTMLESIASRGGWHKLTEQEQEIYRNWQPKGAYNHSDLNRVEANTQRLSRLFQAHGYGLPLIVRTDWQMEDIPTQSDIDRIRANIDYLQEMFNNLPEWRQILYNSTMDFEQANALEWNLHWLNIWLERMIAGLDVYYSGTFYAGEEVVF